jgi:hypothetical protein
MAVPRGPGLAKARIVANGSANAETLLTDGVSVAFTSGEPEAARLRRFGLDARAMGFTDVAGFDRSLRETAGVIGTPLARARLAAYERYTGTVVDRLRGTFAALPEARRPRAASGLMVADEGRWRGHDDRPVDPPCGGRNAAVGLTGNQQPVSIEQVAAWHPDIIIVGGMAKGPDDRPWAAEPALKGIRIVRNPVGVFPWDRYGPEFALQLQWAAALMHPGGHGPSRPDRRDAAVLPPVLWLSTSRLGTPRGSCAPCRRRMSRALILTLALLLACMVAALAMGRYPIPLAALVPSMGLGAGRLIRWRGCCSGTNVCPG